MWQLREFPGRDTELEGKRAKICHMLRLWIEVHETKAHGGVVCTILPG